MEILNLVVGVLALVIGTLAIPPLLQMIFGRPRLTFEADEFAGSEGRILVFAMKNQSTKSWLLRTLGVERESGDVIAFLEIQEQGTGRIVATAIRGRLLNAPVSVEGIMARAMPGFTVGLCVIGINGGHAVIVDARDDKILPIAEGLYTAFATVICGEQTHQIMQRFRVSNVDHETIWNSREVIVVKR